MPRKEQVGRYLKGLVKRGIVEGLVINGETCYRFTDLGRALYKVHQDGRLDYFWDNLSDQDKQFFKFGAN